eukprot:ANDGO_03127.mRNA.1 hypothetical protein
MSSHPFPQTAKTDGVLVSFGPEYETMCRPRAADDEMVPREPHPRRRRAAAGRDDQQQQPRQVPAGMTLVGIDPGRANILTAFDGTAVRSEMRNQWYHATGANAERRWMGQRSGRVCEILDELSALPRTNQEADWFPHLHFYRAHVNALWSHFTNHQGLRHCATVNCPSDRRCVGRDANAAMNIRQCWLSRPRFLCRNPRSIPSASELESRVGHS